MSDQVLSFNEVFAAFAGTLGELADALLAYESAVLGCAPSPGEAHTRDIQQLDRVIQTLHDLERLSAHLSQSSINSLSGETIADLLKLQAVRDRLLQNSPGSQDNSTPVTLF